MNADLPEKLSMKYETVQGAWPRCADIDPAERGRAVILAVVFVVRGGY